MALAIEGDLHKEWKFIGKQEMVMTWNTEGVCGDLLQPPYCSQELNMNLAFSAIKNIIIQTYETKSE